LKVRENSQGTTVMSLLCDVSGVMSSLTFRHLRASVHAWHSPGSVVAPDRPVKPRWRRPGLPGKPMPAAGEAVHVRRLLVVRSRCGLEVSPAPPGGT
jgi:hypothetical protein